MHRAVSRRGRKQNRTPRWRGSNRDSGFRQKAFRGSEEVNRSRMGRPWGAIHALNQLDSNACILNLSCVRDEKYRSWIERPVRLD
jgi:hypothetical protein